MPIKEKKEGSSLKIRLILVLIFCGATIFIGCHMAGAISIGLSKEAGLYAATLKHIFTHPFSLYYPDRWDIYIYTLGVAMIMSLVIMSQNDAPKAEMKGVEHGSNDFASAEEVAMFLSRNTTEIYKRDLSDYKKG